MSDEIETTWENPEVQKLFGGNRAAFDQWVSKNYAPPPKEESYCRLLVKYPMTVPSAIPAMDARIKAAVGRGGYDSGAGFGERDMIWRWPVTQWQEAEEAGRRVREAVPTASVDVSVFGS